MGALENELVNDAIYSYRAAYELGLCVFRILEDKVVTIKGRKVFSPDAPGKLIIVNTDKTHGRRKISGGDVSLPWGRGLRRAPEPLWP